MNKFFRVLICSVGLCGILIMIFNKDIILSDDLDATRLIVLFVFCWFLFSGIFVDKE